MPPSCKLPVDFFTYQIMNLDDRTQLLLTDVRAPGATACRLAYLRTLDGDAVVFQDVRLEVVRRAEPEVDPRGREMRVPDRFRWIVRDGAEEIVSLETTLDSPRRYGHGRGYVGAYTYSEKFRQRPVSGTGYFERADCEVKRAAK
nr:DUF6670 family protein [Amycolatopsis benzoatilytica]